MYTGLEAFAIVNLIRARCMTLFYNNIFFKNKIEKAMPDLAPSDFCKSLHQAIRVNISLVVLALPEIVAEELAKQWF